MTPWKWSSSANHGVTLLPALPRLPPMGWDPKGESSTPKHSGAAAAFYEHRWEAAAAAGFCSLTQFQSPREGRAVIKGGMLEGSDEELYDLFISWQKKKRRKKKERKKKKKMCWLKSAYSRPNCAAAEPRGASAEQSWGKTWGKHGENLGKIWGKHGEKVGLGDGEGSAPSLPCCGS